MTKYPHCPAAFINAIAEEGDKDEAVKYLQLTYDELCAKDRSIEALEAALKASMQYNWLDGDVPGSVAMQLIEIASILEAGE